MIMRRKRCLILYCDTGGGFKSPSVAVKKELEDCGWDVTLLDFAKDLNSSFVDKTIKKGWVLWLKYPWFFDSFLSFMADKAIVTRLLMKFTTKIKFKLMRLIKEEKYDMIFSTHFATTQLIGNIKEKHGLKTPVFAYDADVLVGHRYWVNNGIDRYFLPSQKAHDEMLERGMKKEKLLLRDFPLDNKFRNIRSREEIRKELNIPGKFTILLMPGGEGIKKLDNYVIRLLALDKKPNILVICGKNAALYNRLSELAKSNGNLRVFGFVDNMQDFYQCADVSVGKSGFNFVFESIYMQKPLVIMYAVGNEKIGARFVGKNGLGWWVNTPEQLSAVIGKIMEDEKTLHDVKANLKKFRFSPLGSATMAKDMIKFTEKHREKDVLLFDLSGTLCLLDMNEKNWYSANREGIRNVLKHLKIEKYTEEKLPELAERFVEEKARLRKAAKASLKEYPIKDQLEAFFSTIDMEDAARMKFRNLVYSSTRKETRYNFLVNYMRNHKTCPDSFAVSLYKNNKRNEALFNKLENIFILPELRLAKPVKNASDVLKQLAKRYRLAIIANNVSDLLAKRILKKCRLEKFFPDVFVSSSVGYRKPHDAFMNHVLEEINVMPENCTVIGDRLNQDILIAQKNSMPSIWIKLSKHEDNVSAKGIRPDYEIENISDLLSVL